MSMKLLIVDDDLPFRERLTRSMEKKGFDARKVINKISKYINGTGGGQNFYSTAGGDNLSGIDKAISSFNKLISS